MIGHGIPCLCDEELCDRDAEFECNRCRGALCPDHAWHRGEADDPSEEHYCPSCVGEYDDLED